MPPSAKQLIPIHRRTRQLNPQDLDASAGLRGRYQYLHELRTGRHGRVQPLAQVDIVNLRKRLNTTVAARPEFVEVLVAPAQSGACVEVLRVPLTGAVDWNQLFRAWRQGGR